MILKEKDLKNYVHAMSVAGEKAEKQMAYYLERNFGDRENVFIINDLRFEYNGHFAQIDHLVIHEYGFTVIESKSVTDTIKVDKYEAWVRSYKGRKRGMASPIIQAREQIALLKKLLINNPEFELKASFNMRFQIEKVHYDVFVAISDGGKVEREIDLPELKKADQICEALKNQINLYKKKDSPLNLLYFSYSMSLEGCTKIGDLLIDIHQPKAVKKKISAIVLNKETEQLPVPSEELEAVGVCKDCGSENVEVFNSYGYKVKCRDCSSNFEFQGRCPECDGSLKLSKRKGDFKVVCQECDLSIRLIVKERVKQESVEEVREETESYQVSKVCVKCQSEMVLRTATKGANKGNKFWGCSSYPSCRYVEAIN